jgi:type IV pilus assembly protein PilO
MLALLGSSYFFVFKRMNEHCTAVQQEIRSKQKALIEFRQSTAGVEDLDNRIGQLQKAIDFFNSKLPQEREVDTVLKEVWQITQDNSLQTRTVKTLPSERSASVSEQPIEMTLSGDFKGFYSFLLKLEKMPRLTRVTQMNLQKINEHDGEMQAKVTLSIFFEPDASASAMSH